MAKKSTTTKTIKGTNPDNLPEVKSSVKSLKTQVAAKAQSKAPTKEELQALKVKTAEAEAAKAKAAEAAQAAETTAASSKQAVAATGAEAGAKAAVAADSAATMAGSSASASSAGAGAASSTAASSKAAAASPWAVGAGILGVAAVAAAASGGSSGGSSTPAPQATTPPVADAVNPAPNQQDQNQQSQNQNQQDQTQNQQDPTQNTNPQPPATPTGPAAAGGTAAEPKVATTGITNLKAESFAGTADAAQQPQFLKIVNIFAQESEMGAVKAGEAGARVIRFGDAGAPNAAAAPEGRAEGDAAAAEQNTAYEVIDAGRAVTRAEAEEMAKALGGKLMVIDDATELGWVQHNLTRLLGGYEGSAAKTNGAWVGTSTVDGAKDVDALIRKEDSQNPESEFFKSGADQKFSRFVIEFNDYKSPLLLDGKPVFEGQVIAAADYAKLSWDSTQNKFGRIFVTPAASLEDNTPLNFEDQSKFRAINLSESADVKPGSAAPANPASNGSNDAGADAGNAANTGNGGSQPGGTGNTGNQPAANVGVYDADNKVEINVGHDTSTTLGPANFQGTDPAKAPQFVRITSIVPSGADANAPALYMQTAEGPVAIVNDARHILNASLFDKISWNSTGNTGGKFTFIAVTQDGKVIEGAKEQTVTVTEAAAQTPPAPQPDQGSDTTVPGTPTGGQQPGTPGSGETQQTPPSDQPGTGQNQGGSSGSDTTQQPPSGQQPPAQGGDASSGQQTQPGGSQNTDSQQTDTSKLPTYPETNTQTVAVTYNEANKALNKAIFTGSAADKAPTHIKITELPANAEALKLNGTAVTANQIIAAGDFDKLVWDASKGEDGSFKFVPVAEGGAAIDGAKVQTVTIDEAEEVKVEQPVQPTYPAGNTVEVAVTLNQPDKAIDKSVFAGTVEGNAPTKVKITALPTVADALKLNGVPVTLNQEISSTDFDKLVWDASKIEDGSFKFVATADKSGKEIANGTEQTVTINEPDASVADTSKAPVYEQNKAVEFKLNESKAVGAEVFNGTDSQKAPQFIKITAILNKAGSAAEAGTMLLQDPEANTSTPITLNQVIPQSKFGNILWDASKTAQDDGSFRFQPVTSLDGNTIVEGSTAQTVTINEADALPPAPYKPADVNKEVGKDASTPLDKTLFDGSKENSTNPAFVKIVSVSETADEHSTRVVNGTTAYEVFKVDAGISFADAQAAATRLGGTLLKLDTTEEAEFVKGNVLSKLDSSTDGSEADKAAWMLSTADTIPTGTDKEVLFNNSNELGYADRETGSDKVNNFIVEYTNYGKQKPGLMLEGQSVTADAKLTNEQLGKLTWDSLFNNGGKITFIEVSDAQGTALEGAANKVINITEASQADANVATPKSLDSLLSDELQQHTPLI